MTSKRSFTNLISLLTVALTVGGSALLVVDSAGAQPTGAGRVDPVRMDKMVDRYVDRMAKAVDATPEQKTKLLTIAQAAQADIKPLHDQVHTRMDKAQAESKEILTPEQRSKWDARVQTMRDGMDKHMGDRHDRTEKK